MAAKMFALFALLALCSSAATATHLPWHLPSVMASSAMNPCMQYCMTQQMLTMNPCMQYCMMQQPLAMGSFASPASMMMQQPLQQYWTQYWTQMMMSFQQCHCGAISQVMQVMQQPFMFNPMATAILPMFFQQPFAGVTF
ncbi:hypothetical protein HU200_040571 [Digitaria exilis]|uniref:Uncharacterized protein n=1 Tax=Digitaria exilis TaxID=1010633 RepID=A0A835EGK5_9POAL|nr:hypothetical protein HU200_040571 [Digitaria exilis]